MSKKYDFIGDLANALVKNDWSIMHVSRVAELLNLNGHRDNHKKKYQTNGRGIFTVISHAYNYFVKKGDKETAMSIASSFTNDKNELPWKKTSKKK